MSELTSAGPLVGICFGVLLVLFGVAAGVWWYCKRKHRSSAQGHVITLSQPDPKHQPSAYSQQASGYQHHQVGYPQQQTGYSQRQAGYPQLPVIHSDDVGNADLEVSSAFSGPRAASTAHTAATLKVSSALAPPALPPRSPSPFSPMRPPHELYD